MPNYPHTPGPWICHSGAVWKDGPNVYPKGQEMGIPIARMDREPGNGTQPVERDSNARLIAAAPELLEALAELIDQLEGIGIPDFHGAEGLDLRQARTAITKAKQ